MNAESPTIGHNAPPTGQAAIKANLAEEHADRLARKEELLNGAANVGEIADQESAGKVTDFIKQLTAFLKTTETARVSAKEPYLEGGRAVDGFFGSIASPIENAKKSLAKRLTEYQKQVEERERQARLEVERQAREEAERKRREAEERERKAREAAEAEERRRAEAERKAREAEQAAERARAEKEAADKAAREAKERAKKAQEAEAREKAEREARAAAEARKEAARKAREAERARERQAAEEREAREAAERSSREAEHVHAETQVEIAESVEVAEGAANAASAAARVKASELTGTRGEYGGHSSLRTRWGHGAINREELDLEKLRPHISMDALEKAVRAYIRAGGRELRGVDIRPEKHATVR